MSNLFLRAALVGCATAAAAVAQTPPKPVPTQPVPPPIAVPVPVPTTTFIARVSSPAQGAMILKTFDVADLVCPPADCPLAKPGSDPAMAAAAKAFTEVRAEELKKAVKTGTDRGWWDEYGGGGKMAVTTDGKSLVVNHTPAVMDKVGACVDSIRKLRSTQVKVDVMLFTVSSKQEAMAKLFGDKGHAAVSADEMNVLLRGLKASGEVNVLSCPKMVVMNKQTGFCMVGAGVPVPQAAGGVVTCQPFGMSTRVTPDVSADYKSVALAFEVELNERTAGPVPGVNCQQAKSNVVLPDGGTMLVKVGTRTVELKSECKVPVVGDLPYVGRLFRNVGVCQEPMDTVAVVTVTRVNECDVMPCPTVAITRAAAPPMMPTARPVPEGLPSAIAPAGVFPQPIPLVRTICADGLERVGVNFNTLTAPVTAPTPTAYRVELKAVSPPYNFSRTDVTPVAGACIGTALGRTCEADDTASMMAAYKTACAAGKKDEATRLALQLLAKDPTCFGK